jgi:hypothetical protein
MTDNLVQHETDGNIAIITMNRPEKLNAVNHELRAGVRHMNSEGSCASRERPLTGPSFSN